jgi:hypothetical protein
MPGSRCKPLAKLPALCLPSHRPTVRNGAGPAISRASPVAAGDDLDAGFKAAWATQRAGLSDQDTPLGQRKCRGADAREATDATERCYDNP